MPVTSTFGVLNYDHPKITTAPAIAGTSSLSVVAESAWSSYITAPLFSTDNYNYSDTSEIRYFISDTSVYVCNQFQNMSIGVKISQEFRNKLVNPNTFSYSYSTTYNDFWFDLNNTVGGASQNISFAQSLIDSDQTQLPKVTSFHSGGGGCKMVYKNNSDSSNGIKVFYLDNYAGVYSGRWLTDTTLTLSKQYYYTYIAPPAPTYDRLTAGVSNFYIKDRSTIVAYRQDDVYWKSTTSTISYTYLGISDPTTGSAITGTSSAVMGGTVSTSSTYSFNSGSWIMNEYIVDFAGGMTEVSTSNIDLNQTLKLPVDWNGFYKAISKGNAVLLSSTAIARVVSTTSIPVYTTNQQRSSVARDYTTTTEYKKFPTKVEFLEQKYVYAYGNTVYTVVETHTATITAPAAIYQTINIYDRSGYLPPDNKPYDTYAATFIAGLSSFETFINGLSLNRSYVASRKLTETALALTLPEFVRVSEKNTFCTYSSKLAKLGYKDGNILLRYFISEYGGKGNQQTGNISFRYKTVDCSLTLP